MANTYTKIYIHVIFAVKHRKSLIPNSFSVELYKYMAGIIKNENQFPLKIGGVSDHVHLAFSIKASVAVSDLVRVIKSNSSKWINKKNIMNDKFEWQQGFGAFSYGRNEIKGLIRYINDQEKHHEKKSFKEEYLGILKNHKIDFNDNYVFDWIMRN